VVVRGNDLGYGYYVCEFRRIIVLTSSDVFVKTNKRLFFNEIVYTGSVEYVTTYTTSSETVERSNKFDFFVRNVNVLTRFDYYIIITIYLFI
jgi:hypothetical protein